MLSRTLADHMRDRPGHKTAAGVVGTGGFTPV